MSQKAKKKKTKIKKISFKDKNWYTCKTPKSFNYKEIGDIIGFESNVMNRTTEILLYDITNDFNDISLKLRFKVVDINNESKTCNTIFIGHQYTNDYIRSLIGRGSSKVQSILNLTTKDGWIYRLTVICTTIKRARSSQQILIRKIMTEILKEFASSLNHEKFTTGMIYGEFAKQIQRVAKTIYPLSNSTIIKSKLISVPEGGTDQRFISPAEDFEIVEVDVKRSRKSEIKRSERINVKKFAQTKSTGDKEEEEEEVEEEYEKEEAEE
jgi:small subunit ribosomal protein S3Ae